MTTMYRFRRKIAILFKLTIHATVAVFVNRLEQNQPEVAQLVRLNAQHLFVSIINFYFIIILGGRFKTATKYIFKRLG